MFEPVDLSGRTGRVLRFHYWLSSASSFEAGDTLSATLSDGVDAFINTGVTGGDQIKVAFLFTPATVTPIGSYAVLTDSVDPRAMTTRNRPALAQTFRSLETDETFTAAVNHFKSKGSACDTVTPGTNEIVDPDVGDGQGNCNLSRESMANALTE